MKKVRAPFEIYAFSGKIGSGKNFIAEKVFSKYLHRKQTLVMALADDFKIDAIAKDGANRERVFGSNKDKETRRLLQHRGTEEGRDKYGENIWCNVLYEWMLMYNSRGVERFIITDVRFPNEVNFIQEIGGKVIRVNSPNRTEDSINRESGGDDELAKLITSHPSETSLDSYDGFDFVINNDYGEDVYTVCRDLALEFENEFVINNQPEDLFFVDLDDTICECALHYEQKIDDFIERVRTELNVDDKLVKDTLYRHNNKQYYENLYNREGLPRAMRDTVLELHGSEEFAENMYNLGMEIHYCDFNELQDATNALNELADKFSVVLYTLGHRADQLRKVHKLGIFDIPVEVVDTKKNASALEWVKKRYPAKNYHLIGDSLARDIEPAVKANIKNLYHIEVDNTKHLDDNAKFTPPEGYNYIRSHTLKQVVNLILNK